MLIKSFFKLYRLRKVELKIEALELQRKSLIGDLKAVNMLPAKYYISDIDATAETPVVDATPKSVNRSSTLKIEPTIDIDSVDMMDEELLMQDDKTESTSIEQDVRVVAIFQNKVTLAIDGQAELHNLIVPEAMLNGLTVGKPALLRVNNDKSFSLKRRAS